jgi:hypothetical protein
MSAPQFANAVIYDSGGSGARSVAVADVNGDGKPDLLVGSSGTVGVLLGNGDGTFQSAVTYGSGGADGPGNLGWPVWLGNIVVTDVNADSKPDLIAANNCVTYSDCSNGAVGVLLGNGDGTFQTAVTYNSGGWIATSVAVADVNADGKPDIIVANECTGLGDCGCQNGPPCLSDTSGVAAVLLGNGDGTFQTAVTYRAGYGTFGATSVVVADVNEDGKPDLLMANWCISLDICYPSNFPGAMTSLLGNGDGTFQTAAAYVYNGDGADAVAVGDVNGDGKPDVVVAFDCSDDYCEAETGYAGVAMGNGEGTFPEATLYAAGGVSTTGVALGDINADGNLDILVVNWVCTLSECSGDGSAGVLQGNGDGTFQPVVIYDVGGAGGSSIAVADVNGDGSPDLVVVNRGSSTVAILLNTSPGTASYTALSPVSPGTVTFGTSVTLTANVSSAAGTPPDGKIVTFKNAASNVTLGTGSLSRGSATFTSSAIPAGSYSVVASYPGGSGYWSSVSSPPRVLNVQDFNLAANPTAVTISAAGQHASTTITVTTYGNLKAQTLSKWSCSGLPSASSCSFGSVNTKNQISLEINTTAAADLHWPRFQHPGALLCLITSRIPWDGFRDGQ